MAINPGEFLAVNSDRHVPSPHVRNVLAVLLAGGIKFSEVVALPVWGDVKGRDVLLAADHEDTTDDAGVIGAVHGLSAEDVLARALQPSVKAADQVIGHEGELQLLVILVVHLPQRVLVGLEVIPEPGHGDRAGVFVRVLALPVVEDESRLAKSLQRVLGLLLLGRFLLSRSGGSSGRLGLLLLLGRGVLDHLLSEDGVLNNSLEGGLVDHGLVPAGDARVLRAPGLVQDGSEGAGEEGSSKKVSQGDALANEVGVGGEVALEGGNVLQRDLGGLLNGLLVVGIHAQEGAVPGGEAGQELRVGEGHPAEDRRIVLLGLAQKGGLLVLGGH